MQIDALNISDVKILRPEKYDDARGFFSETFSQRTMREAGIELTFVQDNHVYSASKWTLRGLHFQMPPYAQSKLVRVIRGSVYDVAVDIRRGSPTYGQHVSVVLSAEKWNQILLPIGFAHAFLTLEPDTEVVYKVSNYYAPKHGRSILWNDPDLGIDWPVPTNAVVLSEKDTQSPTIKQLRSPFEYK